MKQVEYCASCGTITNNNYMCDDCLSDDELQWQWREWNNDCPSDYFQWQWKEWNNNSVNELDDIPF